MRRRRVLTFIGIFIVVALAWVYGADAQQSEILQRPAIVTFNSEMASITLDALEQGGDDAKTTFFWHIINLTDDQTIGLEQYQFDDWQSILDEDEELEAVGSREVTLLPSYGFNPPTYRLSVRDEDDNLLSQYVLVIPFDMEALQDATPVIDDFSLNTTSVDINDLARGNALVPATWSVSNRLPTANLVFEQILPDGEVISAELPRERIWVSSQGTGTLAVTAPTSSSEVKFRLRVVDVISGEVYMWKEVALPITGVLLPTSQPSAPPPPTVVSNPGNASSSVQVVSFSASPNPADPTGKVTLSWEVRGAVQVQIWFTPNPIDSDKGTVNGLPLRGSLDIPMKDVWFANGDMVIFSIMPANGNNQGYNDANGWLITATAEVKLKTNTSINSFTTNVATAKRGETISLSWNVSNAARVNLFDNDGMHQNMPTQGSYNFSIPADYPYQELFFTLEAIDGNEVATRRELRFPIACSYTTQLSSGCAFTQNTISAVYQTFQNGYMIWRGDTHEIYVLYSDGVLETYQDTWVDGEVVTITDSPPASLLAPTRGFGKVWATHSGVRLKLGWATVAEASYSTLLETAYDDFAGKFRVTSTYLRLPSNRIVRLRTSWGIWEAMS
jgi:hypothetical protein